MILHLQRASRWSRSAAYYSAGAHQRSGAPIRLRFGPISPPPRFTGAGGGLPYHDEEPPAYPPIRRSLPNFLPCARLFFLRVMERRLTDTPNKQAIPAVRGRVN